MPRLQFFGTCFSHTFSQQQPPHYNFLVKVSRMTPFLVCLIYKRMKKQENQITCTLLWRFVVVFLSLRNENDVTRNININNLISFTVQSYRVVALAEKKCGRNRFRKTATSAFCIHSRRILSKSKTLEISDPGKGILTLLQKVLHNFVSR